MAGPICKALKFGAGSGPFFTVIVLPSVIQRIREDYLEELTFELICGRLRIRQKERVWKCKTVLSTGNSKCKNLEAGVLMVHLTI